MPDPWMEFCAFVRKLTQIKMNKYYQKKSITNVYIPIKLTLFCIKLSDKNHSKNKYQCI